MFAVFLQNSNKNNFLSSNEELNDEEIYSVKPLGSNILKRYITLNISDQTYSYSTNNGVIRCSSSKNAKIFNLSNKYPNYQQSGVSYFNLSNIVSNSVSKAEVCYAISYSDNIPYNIWILNETYLKCPNIPIFNSRLKYAISYKKIVNTSKNNYNCFDITDYVNLQLSKGNKDIYFSIIGNSTLENKIISFYGKNDLYPAYINITILENTSISSTGSNCQDSDVSSDYPDGKNVYVKGFVKEMKSGRQAQDYCTGYKNQLMEYYCLPNGNFTGYLYTCQYTCNDGYCPESCKPKNCSELGKECGNWDNGCGVLIYCGGCKDSLVCNSEGKCSVFISNCTDSDVFSKYPDGNNPYLKGTTKGNNKTFVDYCGFDGKLYEFYCDVSGNIRSVSYYCPNFVNCLNGRCIKEKCQKNIDCLYNSYIKKPLCDINNGKCVECLNVSDCDDGKFCINNSCEIFNAGVLVSTKKDKYLVNEKIELSDIYDSKKISNSKLYEYAYFSSLDNDNVAWIGMYLFGTGKIHVYNLKNNKEKNVNISSSPNLKGIGISGNYLVYTDFRKGKNSIFLYDLLKDKEEMIAPNAVIPRNIDESKIDFISIDKNIVIWLDERNEEKNKLVNRLSDIYVYNIDSKKEKRITKTSNIINNPFIRDNKIVWEDKRNGNFDIYMYDLSNNIEKRITSSSGFSTPTIYGNKIVWSNYSEIFLFDLTNNSQRKIADGIRPIIYKDYIVYSRNGLIYLYDLTKNKEYQLTVFSLINNLLTLKFYNNSIIWSDNRDSIYDTFNQNIILYDINTKMLSKESIKSELINMNNFNIKVKLLLKLEKNINNQWVDQRKVFEDTLSLNRKSQLDISKYWNSQNITVSSFGLYRVKAELYIDGKKQKEYSYTFTV
ncbi:MAG: hypothetical protein QXW97_01850 [Candidatus Pacearchaeota archaeon]